MKKEKREEDERNIKKILDVGGSLLDSIYFNVQLIDFLNHIKWLNFYKKKN